MNAEIELPDYNFSPTVTQHIEKLEYKSPTDCSGFGLYISAKAKGNVVTFPKNTVAGVYTTLQASETEKTTYTFDLTCGEREDDYTWFTCYFGLRLSAEKLDPLPHTGVWLAMRSKQIGMRVSSWPETRYMKTDFDFSLGETVTVVDDPVNNVITIYGGAEKKEIATVRIDGKKVEMYAPGADWETIARVKEAVSIPVLGNGDLFSATDALKMLCETNCDGIMIARGAQGNPWIFAEILAALENRPYSPPALAERIAVATEHAELLVKEKGEKIGIAEARKHLAWYTHGLRGSAAVRGKLMRVESLDDIPPLLEQLEE
jgi:hypothetical protein